MANNVTRKNLLAKTTTLEVHLAGKPRYENGLVANALVLVPGFPESAETFAHQIRAGAKAGLYVIAVNPPGYPGSTSPPNLADLNSSKAPIEICAMLDKLKVARAVFVGHDWGSSIVSKLATQAETAGYVSGLGLLNNAWASSFLKAIFSDETQRKASKYIAYLGAPDGLQFVQSSGFALLRNCFDRTAGKGAYSASERDRGVARFKDPQTLATMLVWYRNLLAIPGVKDVLDATTPAQIDAARAKFADFMKAYPQPAPLPFTGPAAQILGANDPYTTQLASVVPREVLPNMTSQRLATTSHFSHREEPAIVNAMVLSLAKQAALIK